MRKILAWVLGAALAANGLFMLGDPAGWYAAIPGVTMTGPLNPHFVRDVGCAYLMAGAALAAFVVDARARPAALAAFVVDARARPAALAGAAFLALHAFVHLWDLASGRESLHHFLGDLPAVFLPPTLALWLAWPTVNLEKEKHHAEMADSTAHRRV